MLGVAGALAVELLGFGNWFDAPLWVRGSGGVVTVAVLLAVGSCCCRVGQAGSSGRRAVGARQMAGKLSGRL
jgi:hypothetical protein